MHRWLPLLTVALAVATLTVLVVTLIVGPDRVAGIAGAVATAVAYGTTVSLIARLTEPETDTPVHHDHQPADDVSD